MNPRKESLERNTKEPHMNPRKETLERNPRKETQKKPI
jgi:hypothetical protein